MSGQWWESDLIVGPFANIPEANAWAAANPSSLFQGLLATSNGVPYSWGGAGAGWVEAGGGEPLDQWIPVMLDTPNIKAAIKSVLNGTSDAAILFCGDSTTMGVGGDETNARPTLYSYPTAIIKYLNSLGIPAADGIAVPPPANGFNTDARWTAANGWAVYAAGFANYACYRGQMAGVTLRFTHGSGFQCDAYDVYILTVGGGVDLAGSMEITAKGGAPRTESSQAVITDIGASGGVASDGWYIRKVRVACGALSSSNYVTIKNLQNAPNYSWVVAVEPINTAKKQVKIGNCGIGTLYSSALPYNPTAYPMHSSKGILDAVSPSGLVLSIGINDAIANVTPQGFGQAVTSFAGMIPSSCDAVFISPVVSNFNASPTVFQLHAKYTLQADVAGYICATFETPLDTEWWPTSDIHPNRDGYIRMGASFVRQLLKMPRAKLPGITFP